MNTLHYDVDGIKNILEAYLIFPNEINLGLSELFKNLPNGLDITDEALKINVVPDNVSISAKEREHRSGSYWNINIGLQVPLQRTDRINLLLSYRNKHVIVIFKTESDYYIYGNSLEPLKILISEVNSKKPEGFMGYGIQLKGKTTVAPKITSNAQFDLSLFLANGLPYSL